MSNGATFGQRVAKIREERGLSQRALAMRAGTTQQSIWRVETGRQPDPGIAMAKRIARALGVTLDYLVGMHEVDDEDEASHPVAISAA